MKLTEIAIDGLNHFRNIRIGRFADGLNFVYGENSAGKSRLRKFVRDLLFAGQTFDRHSNGSLQPIHQDPFNSVHGFLNVRDGVHEYRLERDSDAPTPLRVSRLDGSSSHSTTVSLQQLGGRLNIDLYETIFNFSFQQTLTNSLRLKRVLETQLAVPRGSQAAGDESAYLTWKRETEAHRSRLNLIQQQIETLRREHAIALQENENTDRDLRTRLTELNRQIESVAVQISGFDIENNKNQLARLDREISDLRILVEETIRRENLGATTIPVAHVGDPFESLYQRLDEIDNQIRRWRRVQTDIQSQRVRLKDEMVVWNDLTLESDEHPYHNAREILVALESKVDTAERHASAAISNNGQRDSKQLPYAIQDLCKNMRDDLYGLCQELAQQYKHIRHRAAAGELKQLRRCYHEMGENIDRLVRRRDAVINEIRSVDPAGADAIQRADAGFCQCAMHEGYLEARRRFVAGSPQSATANIIRTDLSEHHIRLKTLERQRHEIEIKLTATEADLVLLKSRHAQLVRERETVRVKIENCDFNAELKQLESELTNLTAEQNTLLRSIDEAGRYAPVAPNGLLKRAADLLTRLTGGQLNQVWLSEDQDSRFQLRNRIAGVVNYSSLEPAEQDQIYLCLAIAAKEELMASGNDLPMLIDDAFLNISRERVTPTLDLVMELGRGGHQIVVLTQHRYLADRCPGVPVLELPPSTGFTDPVSTPDRSAPLPTPPSAPIRETNYYGLPSSHHDFDSMDNGLRIARNFGGNHDLEREYPFSKYSQSNYPPIADVTEYRDQTNYIVPYPGSHSHDDVPYPERLASRTATTRTPQRVAPVSVEDFGDRLGYVSTVDDSTLLERLDLFDVPQLQILSDLRIASIGQLLELDPDRMSGSLRDAGLASDQLSRWQAYVWLLSNIPSLRTSDARILVACGITEPEHLATSHLNQLYERIQRFLGSSEGQRFANQAPTISLDRINRWYRELEATRSRWQRDRGNSHQSGRRATGLSPVKNGTLPRNDDRNFQTRRPESGYSSGYDRNAPVSEPRALEREPQQDQVANRARTSQSKPQPREPFVARPPRMRTPELNISSRRPIEKHAAAPPIPPVVTSKFVREPEREKTDTESGNEKMRFYLELKDHIEAAPSIGPKTAERFERIGVHTVEDFLKQTAESMAAKLKYKRITADIVRAWQHQARLVCRIPNLRGHDAQLLVACDFTEPETIATMQPKKLFEVIGPFAQSKDGQKIIRTGKNPDLAEVTDWISWATQTRSLQAA